MARMDMPEGANVAVPGTYSLIQSALSNRGNPTSGGFGNLMVVEQNQPVRIVDNKTGKVVFEGIGPDAARRAVELGQNISDTKGNKAAWSIQTVPVGTDSYKTIANEKANRSDLARIADVALPAIGAALFGPLGAAAGSAASGIAQGRGIEDILLRAAIAGGTSAVAPGAPTPGGNAAANAVANTALQNAVNAGAQAGSQALGSVYGSAIANAVANAAGSAATSALAPAIGDIIVTGARNAVPSALTPALASGVSNALVNQVINPSVQQPQPSSTEQVTPPDITVTAKGQPFLLDSVGPALTSAIASTAVPALTQPTTTTTEPKKENILNKPIGDWGVRDWLDAAAVGGIGVDLLAKLLGGGGGSDGTGAVIPYVSPFGPDGGISVGGLPAGQNRQLNPNIADYEKYGFGPEALFFAPQPSSILSATAAAPESATVNPKYVPLI